MKQVLGVIGGTGLYDMPGLAGVELVTVDTPFGSPSDQLVHARLAGTDRELVFLPRHGRGHRVPPHAINYRANTQVLDRLAARHVAGLRILPQIADDDDLVDTAYDDDHLREKE